MAMIVRDLMVGSEKLKEMDYLEEAEGHNDLGWFPGAASVDRPISPTATLWKLF